MLHLGKKASLLALSVMAVPVVASAAPLFSEDFDTDHTANWVYNTSINGDTASRSDLGGAADFHFDYSTVGIPAAPGGTSTIGMQLQANLPGTNGGTGIFSAISASPKDLVLPSSYKLTFYAWQNTVGAFPAGGSGSTQLTNASVGVSGATAEFAGGTMTGVQFAASGDGGTNPDYRAYTALMPHTAGGVLTGADGVYSAGTDSSYGNNSNTYYTALNDGTSIQPPSAQAALYPSQTGKLAAGTPAFAWRLWEIDKTGDSITWSIDGLKIATVPASLFPATFGGDNISFGQADINAGPSTDANAAVLQFGLIDNITVSAVPEPASLGLVGIGAAALLGRRRRMA
jgi:hypothetical protein